MPLTYDQAVTILQKRIANSSDRTEVEQALDEAQREVARARRWPELMARAFFNTAAAYSTGTVAVSEGGTTWTLTSGTFPTAAATGAYRIALSVSDPWYTVTARGSGTEVTTAAYQDDTETASTYIIYKSQYKLSTAVDRVEELWLHDGGRAVPLINAATDQIVTEFLHYPSGPGVPTHYYHIERNSDGAKQILLGPETPDDIYRVEYTYRKKVTDGTFDGNLDETRWPLIVQRALAELYEPEFYERSLKAMQRYEYLLRKEWVNEGASEIQHVTVGEARHRYPGGDDYMNNLLGFGRVQDPS